MTDLKLSVRTDAVTALELTGWLCPIEHPPPLGKKIQLLTYTGIATYGCWNWYGFIAWAPCLKVEGKIRERVGKLPDWEKLGKVTTA
jgi:hypothetical protein